MHYSDSCDILHEDCVFCKIVEGKLPAFKVYEDEKYLAFLDKFPRNPGHVQVIPKHHYRWVYDVPDFGGYMEVVKKVVEAVKKAMSPRLVHLITIGDEVPHAHVWVVPRFEDDGYGALVDISKVKQMSDDEMKALAQKILSAMV